MVTPVHFPAAMGGWPATVIAEQIESIERDDYDDRACKLVMVSGRRIAVGCSQSRAAEIIARAGAKPLATLTDPEIDAVTDAQWGRQHDLTGYQCHRAYARAVLAAASAKTGGPHAG